MKKLKALEEKRADLQARMVELATITEGAEGVEARALNEEEMAEFDRIEKELRSIDDSIAIAEKARKVMNEAPARTETEDRAAAEERDFEDYVMGRVQELRTGEQNMTMGNNGAIVPVSIANRIIKKVKDLCPILEGCTMYAVKGTIKVPVWGKAGENNDHDINVAFSEEFTELTADSGRFTSVDLGGFIAGALTLIGRSVENNAVFNVTEFIIDQMGEEIAAFLENKLLNGEANKNTGALSTTNNMNAGSTTAVTMDNLIDLQARVKQVFQAKACWTMHPETFTAIKKLKDIDNQYILNHDAASEFPYRLLGKPVYLSDNMPKIGSGKKAILYGDYAGLSVNFRENISVQVLREKYATQHANGVVAWFEFDSKVTDSQRLATLTMSTNG